MSSRTLITSLILGLLATNFPPHSRAQYHVLRHQPKPPRPEKQPTAKQLPAPAPIGHQADLQDLKPLAPRPPIIIPHPVAKAKPPGPLPILTLERVLTSVDKYYPLVSAALQERGIAQGRLQSATGLFDLNLIGHDRVIQGSFDSHRFGMGLAQPLAFQGIDLTAGYRVGAGDFPVYYGNRLTAQGGEFSLGMNLPLLQDRAVDARRANWRKAELGRQMAEPRIVEQRLAIIRSAAAAYWKWVAAGRRLQIARQLLNIAEKRDEFLLKRLKAGAEDKIEVLDNRRLIVDRRTRLVTFKGAYEQASINLSLFLRDETGKPQRPDGSWLARRFPRPTLPSLDGLTSDIELALAQRPEVQAIALQRQKLLVDLNLAQNQALPSFDIVLVGAQDVGQGKSTLDRYTYEAGVLLNVPLQRNQARGAALTTQAKLAQLNAQERYLRDRIAAEVQSAVTALVRAFEAYQFAQQTVQLNRLLEEAEIKKRNLGNSNILFVNLRELARADAELQEISALENYFQAVADYYVTLGLDARGFLDSTAR